MKKKKKKRVLAVGLAAAVAVVAGTVAATSVWAASDRQAATVESVTLSGATMNIDGATVTVTLAGVLLPSDDAEGPTGCMASEAAAFLSAKLPIGTQVELESATAPASVANRAPVGIWADGVLVNAEIVRAGYAAAGSARALPSVAGQLADAEKAAAAAGVGLHSTSAPCTVPAKVKAYADKVKAAQGISMPTGDLAAFDTRLSELQSLRAEGEALVALLDGKDSVLPMAAYADSRTALASSVDAQTSRVDALTAGMTAARAAEQAAQDRAEAERQAARDREQAAADRRAAEKAAKEAAADRAAAEQAARDAEDYYYYGDPSDWDGDGFPDDGTPYDCIAPWDYTDTWTGEDEENYYACLASMP